MSGRVSQKDVLLRLVDGESPELFHDAAQRAYISFRVHGVLETWPVLSSATRSWLARLLFDSTKGAASAETISAVRGVLEARARFDGVQREVAVRIAGDGARVFLDLGDESWSIVAIDANGWRMMCAEDAPVRFRRPAGLLALPAPVAGGSLAELSKFANASGDELVLIVGWLVIAARPCGPYPVLVLQGEQGSGKSTTARVLRRLLDPNKSEIRSQPREDRELAIAASNGWIMAFDNLSGVPTWLSDALCRISTGGGFAARALYTDSDEILFDAQRPILLNGIESPATRGDLLDRSLVVTLPRLESVRLEREFWREFEEARPRMLGALLDALSMALRHQAEVPPLSVSRLRMSDGASWVAAAEPALPWTGGAFLRAYTLNRRDAADLVLESSVIATMLAQVLDAHADGMWTGTAGQLLSEINALVDEKSPERRSKDWPKSPRGMAAAISRLAPAMRQAAIKVEMPKPVGRRRDRVLQLQRVPQTSFTLSASTADSEAEVDSQAYASTLADDLGAALPDRPPDGPRASARNGSRENDADDTDDLSTTSRSETPVETAEEGRPIEGEL